MNLKQIGIRHSPLTDSIYLCRFGKNKNRALDKRDCEPELMEAITNHMMLNAPKGAKKQYYIDDRWYEIQIKPITVPGDRQ